MVSTEDFNPDNKDHQQIKQHIMLGNGLSDINSTHEVHKALHDAGFEILEARNLVPEADPNTPWYRALQGRDLSLIITPRTPIGRALTNFAILIGESFRLAPKGTRAVSTFLNKGADAVVEGSQRGVFTPIFFFLAWKP